MDTIYYDKELDIEGTSDELFAEGTRYYENCSDEKILKIVDILRKENRTDDANRVLYTLESEQAIRAGKTDVGVMKLGIMDDLYSIYDKQDGNDEIELFHEHGADKIVLQVSGPDYLACSSMDVAELMQISSEEFDKFVNETCYYNKEEIE